MRREDLIGEQAEAIKETIAPMLGYLNRLKKRMNAVFAQDDSLFAEVIDAADALHKQVEIAFVFPALYLRVHSRRRTLRWNRPNYPINKRLDSPGRCGNVPIALIENRVLN